MTDRILGLRWYTYSKPLEVISVAEYDPTATRALVTVVE